MDKDRVLSVLHLARAALYVEPYRCADADVAWSAVQIESRVNARHHITRLLDDLCTGNAGVTTERIEVVMRLALEALNEQPAQCGSSGWAPAQARLRRDAKRAIRSMLAEFAKETQPILSIP